MTTTMLRMWLSGRLTCNTSNNKHFTRATVRHCTLCTHLTQSHMPHDTLLQTCQLNRNKCTPLLTTNDVYNNSQATTQALTNVCFTYKTGVMLLTIVLCAYLQKWFDKMKSWETFDCTWWNSAFRQFVPVTTCHILQRQHIWCIAGNWTTSYKIKFYIKIFNP